MAKVYKHENGTYYFVASLGFDRQTGKRIQKTRRGFKTKKSANQAYNELLNDYGKMAFLTNSSMSYGMFFKETFVPWYQGRVSETTFETRYSGMRKYFSYFFKYKLSEITPMDVQKWQNNLKKTLKNSYVRILFGMFSMSLERAVVLGIVPKNVAKVVGNVKKEKRVANFWTNEEFELAISVFDLSDYYEFYSFLCIWLLFMTGMRFGEAQALLWTDVDFLGKSIRIDKTMHYKNAEEFSHADTKTVSSRRTISVDEDTLGYLKLWREQQMKSDYILSYNELPSNKHGVRHILKRVSKLCGLKDITIHDLRHSHASLLISMNEQPLIIRDRLGHSDIQTTLGTYGHLYPNSHKEVAEKLSGYIQQTSKVIDKPVFNGNQYIKKRGK